jgi:hypothetical protein
VTTKKRSRALSGNQSKQKFLEALTFVYSQLPKMNAHLTGTGEAYDGPGTHDGVHFLGEMQADVHGGTDGNGLGRLDEDPFHADVDGLTVDLLVGDAQLHLGSVRDTAGSAPLMLDVSLRGANQL